MSSNHFFKDKVAIVTGSSSGIGRETARMLGVWGAKIVIIGRSEPKFAADSIEDAKCEMLADGVKEENIIWLLADLCDPDTPRRIVTETINTFGRIDILINSAGALATDLTVRGIECPIEHFDTVMNIHCKAVILLVREVLPHLKETKGSIVNVSSLTALPFMNHFYAYYSMAKAAQDQLTVQMAGHFIKDGVRVNAVLPSIVATPMSLPNVLQHCLDTPGCLPIGRLATVADIAKVILFLADRSQSGYVNGVRIPVDGGAHLMNHHNSLDMV